MVYAAIRGQFFFMLYDIVIPLKAAEPNEDLRFTLRSIEKYGAEYGTIWLVGYCPRWVQNVRYLPTRQFSDKWTNTLRNRIVVCEQKDLSDKFLLFNDDFILTRPVKSWEELTACNRGRLIDYAETLEASGQHLSRWQNAFRYTHEVLRAEGIENPINYEYHGAMIFDKTGFLATYRSGILDKYQDGEHLLLHRSIHGNLFPPPNSIEARYIEDPKLRRKDAPDDEYLTRYGFFSVADGMIGATKIRQFPRINGWLAKNLNSPSSFEIRAVRK